MRVTFLIETCCFVISIENYTENCNARRKLRHFLMIMNTEFTQYPYLAVLTETTSKAVFFLMPRI